MIAFAKFILKCWEILIKKKGKYLIVTQKKFSSNFKVQSTTKIDQKNFAKKSLDWKYILVQHSSDKQGKTVFIISQAIKRPGPINLQISILV